MISIRNAEKYYNKGKQNELHVLNNISLELPDRGMIAIFGRSGCGKTTLLNAIGGLDTLASGEILIEGSSLKNDPETVRNRDIGYIFQNYNLSRDETVFENIADALRLCGMTDPAEIEERVMAALRNVDMERYQKRTPDTLSGGQQQRVAIARAIVKNPAIILADEPTGNLDETNTVMIMDLLKAISRDHLVLLVTHEANLVDYYCDRVIELSDGRVESVRDNDHAKGYDARDKNDIYLGELPCQKGEMPGLSVSYYGEPAGEIRLKIVSTGGKLYLQSDTPGLRILDAASEVKLREGVFAPKGEKTEKKAEDRLDMSHLTPFEGKHFGRLFNFKKSLSLAWRSNFSQKQKRSSRLLRVCLVLMAVVLVFMSSSFAVILRDFRDLRKSSSEKNFWLPLSSDTDLDTLYHSLGENGIAALRMTSAYMKDAERDWRFFLGNFMTANTQALSASGALWGADLAADLTCVAGTKELSEKTDVLLTTAMADAMIASSPYAFLDGYDSLIGLISAENIPSIGRVRIAGIVESEERCVYADPLVTASRILYEYVGGLSLTPLSWSDVYSREILPGEIVYYSDSEGSVNADITVGKKLLLLGREYRVAEVVVNDYEHYVENHYQTKLEDLDAYTERVLASGEAEDAYQASYMWFWDYYYRYYSEYCASNIRQELYRYIEAYYPSPTILSYLLRGDDQEMWIGYCYREKTGRYPTAEDIEGTGEFAAFRDELLAEDRYHQTLYEEELRYQDEFYRYLDSIQYWTDSSGFILSDADYQALSYTVGPCDDVFGYYDADYLYSYLALLIYSEDPAATEKFLSPLYGNLETPDDIFEEKLDEMRENVIGGIISIVVVLALMCLSVFILMRTSLMRRVREVGIYRAIGVSKKNLVFRFLVEAALLSVMTTLIGYLAATAVVMWFSGLPLLSAVFYFPWWLALSLFGVLFAALLLAGILPLCLLLSKTPSAILAKYDI